MRMRLWAAIGRLATGLFCLALLTSIGGAGIYAAPVTLPVLWLAARDASALGRALLNVVAVLTAGELGWAVAYQVWGERTVAIWLVPVVAAVAVFFAYPLTQRSGRRLVA